MSVAPVTYKKGWIFYPEQAFTELMTELDWVSVAGNRLEYYVNQTGNPYVYGQGKNARAYQAQPMHPTILRIREQVEELTGEQYEVCFLNQYRDGKDNLGWHADNSPEMDDARHIAVVSLGQAREFWVRENPPAADSTVNAFLLETGSIALMHPGMQDTHQHRIPRAGFSPCGPRISLTFRGYSPTTTTL